MFYTLLSHSFLIYVSIKFKYVNISDFAKFYPTLTNLQANIYMYQLTFWVD